MSLWKKTSVLAVAGLTALALTACGGAKSGGDEQAPPSVLQLLVSDIKGSLQKTIETTDTSDSVTVTMRGTVAGESVSTQGVIDLRGPVKAELTTEVADGNAMIVRMIDGVVYVEIPAEERAELGGKRWMKVDLDAVGAQAGMDFSKQLEDVDPTKQVKTLLSSEGVTVVGEETLDGTSTVHYTVTTPLATHLEQVDAALRSEVEKQLAAQGVEDVTIDLWVDEQYRPRRAGVVMGTMAQTTVDYTDYGKPVEIETPPAAETVDFADMLQGLKELPVTS
ncbi:LolA-like protein [Micromonospora radicis]|uniref:LppX_LprAFG lipoprotein n=1 Tax=Micromonospora radicis TaxID=1894971 RepID=A0A418MY46_9ACTN|nr:hypothetical protein [Micromonospora radicis]RIV40053.1 hypothetical protein D2L64_06965 [Micromonospora radicis]